MKAPVKILLPPSLVALLALALFSTRSLQAHCEVPCGIFDDQLRFEAMLEDEVSIAKAIKEIRSNTSSLADGATPLAVNQAARWVSMKETHAERIQHTIAQYFMAQRIKPAEDADDAHYSKTLIAAHQVMRAAMKTKQDAAPETAVALRKTILDFYRVYMGKEPDFI